MYSAVVNFWIKRTQGIIIHMVHYDYENTQIDMHWYLSKLDSESEQHVVQEIPPKKKGRNKNQNLWK